ncbi:hypothetical protein, partial [Mesorhizobium sp.]|uniref:hypothetical protein n=1 Tax=Mesorhizobium sp. TaxID=1871066 RepID=UPI00257BBE5E
CAVSDFSVGLSLLGRLRRWSPSNGRLGQLGSRQALTWNGFSSPISPAAGPASFCSREVELTAQPDDDLFPLHNLAEIK